jgi:acyl carrier protein
MSNDDALRDLLIEFFQLPEATPTEEMKQSSVANWDSLAMVQLITELQTVFKVEFGLEEIERLTSYSDIRASLLRKNVPL